MIRYFSTARECAILISVVSFFAFSSVPADARTFHAHYQGSNACCAEDLNQDQNPAGRGIASGTSSLGAVEISTVIDVDLATFHPPEGLCPNEATSIRFFIADGSAVMRFSDGSMLFKEIAKDGRESFICFDFVAQSVPSAQVSYTVTGGTKRLQGATGQTVGRATNYLLPGQSAFDTIETGNISLPE